jgi:hypothetical protein
MSCFACYAAGPWAGRIELIPFLQSFPRSEHCRPIQGNVETALGLIVESRKMQQMTARLMN